MHESLLNLQCCTSNIQDVLWSSIHANLLCSLTSKHNSLDLSHLAMQKLGETQIFAYQACKKEENYHFLHTICTQIWS